MVYNKFLWIINNWGGKYMYTHKQSSEIDMPMEILKKYDMLKIAYFDIETTGFDKEQDSVILISVGYYEKNNIFTIKQYFGENLTDEKEVLEKFSQILKEFDIWCSYNGKAFDEPFIKYRSQRYDMNFNLPKKHIDLYRMIRPYQKQLGLTRCNLKSVERYVGIERKDTIDGGISVELYKKYIKNKEENLRKIMMLHNFEDVYNLPQIFNVVWKIENTKGFIREDHITDKQMGYIKYLLNKNKVIVDLNFEKISKKVASKIIASLLEGNSSNEKLQEIVQEFY